eukprot:TRINITY_DN94574_c0_g1_i1.p1 TRINITY_DN94574_c0_g1~~TRINITY_DN94574_c0_g1_i1.p1  ORF type:complete len:265 (+),score=30.48 TRINITY_DN94574_c0_g1_i1:61-855(+)
MDASPDLDHSDTGERPMKRQRVGCIRYISRPGGILDPTVLKEVFAIAQQSNCVGCDGRGLAEAIAKQLPYGDTYRERRRAGRFAVPEDRATPGTIAVRHPPAGDERPIVISMFAQWEMGPALKYNRVKLPPNLGTDSREQREKWFVRCLEAISRLDPKPASIAFPHQIGCGLAGGNWNHYNDMLTKWAEANQDVQVTICTMGDSPKHDASLAASSSGRAYLACPFKDRDAVKMLGARWDAAAKKWYVPSGMDTQPFAKWLPKAP